MSQKPPRLRLPSDTGPNPYDSKTPLKDLTPDWLTWKWWLAIIPGAVILGVSAYLKTRH